ncbi:hypothetical protein JVT61DRAFT_1073 [Boletus reticuloceps]|uniref:Uncharacterized protein n=1 Tax=Boletus reticuloceps TaxID=495285 RepID=A0A8I2YS01_9AGAM|nr:hypothetical protein JVT61DRAFT_1073 [Boletus reticuloceps]
MRLAMQRPSAAPNMKRAVQRLSTFRGRSSKSATTSPVSTPYHSGLSLKGASADVSYIGARDWPAEEDVGRTLDKLNSAKRRTSGPAWQMTPMTQDVRPTLDSSRSAAIPEPANGRIPTLGHTLHPSHPPVYRHLATHEDSPSPLSSDSDSIPPHHAAQNSSHTPFARPRAPYPAPTASAEVSPKGVAAIKPEFAFTPSASPFLGPLRTLNLQSTNPSRAPSPILLPPAQGHSQNDAPVSPIEGRGFRQRSRGSSIVGSPPGSKGVFGPASRKWSSGEVSQMATLPHVHTYPGQLSHAAQADRGLYSLPTPQLSSGPSSSSGSSPGSVTYPLQGGGCPARPTFETAPMTQSPSSSRPAVTPCQQQWGCSVKWPPSCSFGSPRIRYDPYSSVGTLSQYVVAIYQKCKIERFAGCNHQLEYIFISFRSCFSFGFSTYHVAPPKAQVDASQGPSGLWQRDERFERRGDAREGCVHGRTARLPGIRGCYTYCPVTNSCICYVQFNLDSLPPHVLIMFPPSLCGTLYPIVHFVPFPRPRFIVLLLLMQWPFNHLSLI